MEYGKVMLILHGLYMLLETLIKTAFTIITNIIYSTRLLSE